MSVYTVPSLSAVDFALVTHSPATITPATQALAVYTPPAVAAVDFALVTWTPPTYMDVGWELLQTFPTQVPGWRIYDNGAVRDLCLVALADAPSGPQLRLRKGSTTYAVYLVETTDGQASPVRVRLSTGTKAIRWKT